MVSYYLIMLLWSGVGGQLFDHHVAVVRGWWLAIDHHVAMVKGWWLAIDTFFRRTLSRSFREKSKFFEFQLQSTPPNHNRM